MSARTGTSGKGTSTTGHADGSGADTNALCASCTACAFSGAGMVLAGTRCVATGTSTAETTTTIGTTAALSGAGVVTNALECTATASVPCTVHWRRVRSYWHLWKRNHYYKRARWFWGRNRRIGYHLYRLRTLRRWTGAKWVNVRSCWHLIRRNHYRHRLHGRKRWIWGGYKRIGLILAPLPPQPLLQATSLVLGQDPPHRPTPVPAAHLQEVDRFEVDKGPR